MDEGYTRWLMGDVFGEPGVNLPPPPAWHADAACRDADTSTFFPEKGATFASARAMCADCPVREQCLDAILAAEGDVGPTHRFGVWGGLSAKERADLARQAA